jgi:hypothetical protein
LELIQTHQALFRRGDEMSQLLLLLERPSKAMTSSSQTNTIQGVDEDKDTRRS